MHKRYYVLDALRGFALFNMLAYHMFWDMFYLFSYNIPWFKSIGAYIWQQAICITFIFLSGFTFSLGKHILKRGFIVFSFGLLISVVTFIVMPDDLILFGVLTLIGSCMLIMFVLDKAFKNTNPYIGLICAFVLFLLFRNVNRHYLGFYSFNFVKLPNFLYKNMLTAYLGFPYDSFYSSDYFSLIPWLFLYIGGYFLHKIFIKKDLVVKLEGHIDRLFEYFGQHSLQIYLLHQPLIFLILLLFN